MTKRSETGDELRTTVRRRYAAVAREDTSCCNPSGCGCGEPAAERSRALGYTDAELSAIPADANLGAGCGTPLALAAVGEGDTVLDLGSGAGIDCFLAAKEVGPQGRVIGVDMTPEMIDRARRAAAGGGYENVEFRLGEIENLPVADASVDAVVSNCVINLSPDKARVFREAFRVLKPGGVLAVSDICLEGDLPEAVKTSVSAYVGCVAGAERVPDYLDAIRRAGFDEVEVVRAVPFPADGLLADEEIRTAAAAAGLTPADLERTAGVVVSAAVRAVKPRN